MGNVAISGSLQGGPPTGGNSFPGAQFQTPLKLSVDPKAFQSASGILTRVISSIGVFVPLAAVGAAADVVRANFVYVRADGDYQLRITQDDGAAGTTVATVQCRGLFMFECPDNLAVVLLEFAGSGTIEYFASGPS